MASSDTPGEDGGAWYPECCAACTFCVFSFIIPPALQGSPILNWEDAMDHWSESYSEAPPEVLAQHRQKNWHTIKTTLSANLLLETAPDPRTRARLLASRVRESGA